MLGSLLLLAGAAAALPARFEHGIIPLAQRDLGAPIRRSNDDSPADLPIAYNYTWQQFDTAVNLGIDNTPEKLRKKKELNNDEFVTRNGSQLYLKGQLYRFAGFASPHLLGPLGDGSKAAYEFEISKTYESFAAAFPNAATRTYVFRFPTQNISSTTTQVTGYDNQTNLWKFNETNMVQVDYALASARDYGNRIIIPFINQRQKQDFAGDQSDFIQLLFGLEHRNQSFNISFYRNDTVVNAFKVFIGQVLNRTNTINGIRYGDDPTLLAWETGNELQDDDGVFPNGQPFNSTLPAPGNWTVAIAEHIKALAPNTLVLDGSLAKNNKSANATLQPDTAASPAVDIFSWVRGDMLLGVNISKAVNAVGKAFIAGEVGFTNSSVLEDNWFSRFYKTEGAGSLVWSFRPQGYSGGYVVHSEGNDIFSYHVPGLSPPIDSKNFDSTEVSIVETVTNASFYFAHNYGPPYYPIPGPAPKWWFNATSNESTPLIFQGATWAQQYELWAQCQPQYQWQLYNASVFDNVAEGMFSYNISNYLINNCAFAINAVSKDYVPGIPTKPFYSTGPILPE